MFFTLLIVTVVIVSLVILLPYWMHLVNYQYEKKQKKPNQKSHQQTQSQTYSYVPPDEQTNQESVASTTGIRHLTTDDIPVKLKLNQSNVARRKEKLDVDRNPNNYDYDLDDIINEDDSEVKTVDTPFSKEIV